jgi:hypothetical protein
MGLLVYRGGYSCDEMWAQFLLIVRWNMEQGLGKPEKEDNDLDLLPSLIIATTEDPNILDGASTDDVRKIFRTWFQSKEARAELGDGLVTTRRYIMIQGTPTASTSMEMC